MNTNVRWKIVQNPMQKGLDIYTLSAYNYDIKKQPHDFMEEENMKKIIALLLSILMVCSLAACASKQDTAAATETASTETAASSSEEKTLTMATNVAFPPYEFHSRSRSALV